MWDVGSSPASFRADRACTGDAKSACFGGSGLEKVCRSYQKELGKLTCHKTFCEYRQLQIQKNANTQYLSDKCRVFIDSQGLFCGRIKTPWSQEVNE